MLSVRLTRLFMSLLILMILILAGCQRTPRTPEADSAAIQIALQPIPEEEILVVVLTDASGAPVIDATVAAEGNMNHAGMIPVLADPVADDADGRADGRYHLPFAFTMWGDWIVSVTVTQADGSEFKRDLEVRNTGDGLTGDMVMPMDAEHDADAHDPPSAEEESSATDAAHDHAAESNHDVVIHIQNPAARPAPLAGGTAAIYFSLHNGSDGPVTFVGGETPAAAAVEIHTTINDNGVMRMRQLPEGVEFAADEAVEFVPGGMHLMLIDLAAPLMEGDTLTLTLHFEGADDLTVEVPVVNLDDMPEAEEMEHNH